jgi:aarF domain-containing kinase
MEATARALRLISTAVLIVTDYESAKIKTKLFPEQNPERVRWEKEKEMRRQELEDAQIAYTSPKPAEMVEKSGKTRQEFIVDQKESVHLAAERLAEAEEELSTLGDRKSEVHQKAANRLLELCRRNGGVYIKIGQHLANLDYLIPQEYTEALSSLFDDTPQSCKYARYLLQICCPVTPSNPFFLSLR